MIATKRVQATRPSRASTVAVSAGLVQRVQGAAAAAVAAVILASPANAGVVLVQPELKKIGQSAPAAPKPVSAEAEAAFKLLPKAQQAPKAKAAPKPKDPEVSVQGKDLDPRSIALPGSLVLIAAGAAAWTQLDKGFAEFMDEASAKNSNIIGVGYEPTIKAEGGFVPIGTKKVKASGGFFGKKK